MRANTVLFWLLGIFFFAADVAYTIWSIIVYGQPEYVGTVALALTAILGIFLGFYLGRTHAAQSAELPEDRLDAHIDDGDPEIGNFSPWSWWPFILATAAGLTMLGFAVGLWICFIGISLGLIALVGWVYEYYRGFFAR